MYLFWNFKYLDIIVRSNKSFVQAHPNVHNSDTMNITTPLINRMKVEEKSDKIVNSYVRSIERLFCFYKRVFYSPTLINLPTNKSKTIKDGQYIRLSLRHKQPKQFVKMRHFGIHFISLCQEWIFIKTLFGYNW